MAVQGLGIERHLIIGQKGSAAPAAGHSRRLLDDAKSIWTMCQVCFHVRIPLHLFRHTSMDCTAAAE